MEAKTHSIQTHPPRIQKMGRTQNAYHHLAGSAILFLNKFRHEIQGYTSPRGFDISQVERGVDYDLRVADRYLSYLKQYKGEFFPLDNLNVLELGPGADLGVGLYLLQKGIKTYHSLDVHNLVKSVPKAFYDHLFSKFESIGATGEQIQELKQQLHLTQVGDNDRLNYLCREDFDITVFKKEKINYVVSNAAFEHFDSPSDTIQGISQIVDSGAIFFALVDLKTHTRWIRDVDPLNIYRYKSWYYNFLKFRGSPNRVRAADYLEILEKNGWTNIEIIPTEVLEKDYVKEIRPTLARRYRDQGYDMTHLSIVILAEKA